MGTHADANEEARTEGKQQKEGQQRKVPVQERHRAAAATALRGQVLRAKFTSGVLAEHEQPTLPAAPARVLPRRTAPTSPLSVCVCVAGGDEAQKLLCWPPRALRGREAGRQRCERGENGTRVQEAPS